MAGIPNILFKENRYQWGFRLSGLFLAFSLFFLFSANQTSAGIDSIPPVSKDLTFQEVGTVSDASVKGKLVLPEATNSCERGRVRIVNHQVVADNGEPLRGDRDLALSSKGYDLTWTELAKKFHLNTVRLLLYQKPQNFPGGCGWNCNWIPTVQESIPYIDKIVDEAAQKGFYVVIDYHPVGGVSEADAVSWWSVIAPRYKDRKHVLYEIANEPVAWRPSDYNSSDIAFEEHLYTLVRSLAPHTHLILWTYANATSGMYEKVSQAKSISYDNASVGFHPYQFDQSAYDKLVASYPVINTEIGGYKPGEYNDRTQKAEDLGVSWLWLDGVKFPDTVKVNWTADPKVASCNGLPTKTATTPRNWLPLLTNGKK